MNESISSPSNFYFYHTLRVRWAEVDAQGIVFNGHYLMYFDVSITEYFRNVGLTFPDGLLAYGSDLFVKKASLEYHQSARFDDLLNVYVRVANIGNSSIRFELEIFRNEDHLISGEVIYVNADPVAKKATLVPVSLRERIEKFESGGKLESSRL